MRRRIVERDLRISNEEFHDWLWNFTAFPFSEPTQEEFDELEKLNSSKKYI